MSKTWKITERDADWECDWEGSVRFQLRYFKALSFTEKVRAIEGMCETVDYFVRKARARQGRDGTVSESS